MLRTTIISILLFAASPLMAEDATQKQNTHKQAAKPQQVAKVDKTRAAQAATPPSGDAKTLAGISILGNQEAPKSLVIVPWKGSEIGAMPGLSRLLDDAVQPVDKDVFMRELAYYEIRQSKQ
jgi:hypothetical protein